LQNGADFPAGVLSTNIIFTSNSSCLLPLSCTPPFLTTRVLYILSPSSLWPPLLLVPFNLHKCVCSGSVCISFAFNVSDVFQAYLHCAQKQDSVTFSNKSHKSCLILEIFGMKNNFHHIAPTESASTVYGRVRSNLVALLRSHRSPAVPCGVWYDRLCSHGHQAPR